MRTSARLREANRRSAGIAGGLFFRGTTVRVALLGLLGLTFAAFGQKAGRPNVVLILADDMGFSDIGPYGGEIETPNLDRLAAGGLKFSQFYNSARCCPTRASLMTGLHPHETGIGHMTNTPGTSSFDYGEAFPGYRGYLNDRCVTIAEALGQSGYATMMAGKWHLGQLTKDRWPLQRGFEKFYGCISGATHFFKPEHPRGIYFGNVPIEEPKSTTDRRYYTTDAFTDYAIRFINEERNGEGRPFFLYLAYTSPHWPLHAHQEEVEKYKKRYLGGWDALREERWKRQIELGLIDPKWALTERGASSWEEIPEKDREEKALRMAYYAAMVDRMDQNIGKLVNHLKRTGQFDNTLIFFLSDNGGCAEGGALGGKTSPLDLAAWEGSYGASVSYGEVWANASNTPFREYKHYTHEGGMATPFIAHWPAGIRAREEWVTEPAYLPDVMPTILEVAKTKYPAIYNGRTVKPLSGESLTPLFRNKRLKRSEPMYFEHEDNAALRDGDWKLVGKGVSAPGGPDATKWELYNLREDRTETRNLAERFPERLESMRMQWDAWSRNVGVYPKPAKKKAE